ncbi:hypothetical protein AWN88_11330 [Agrobacterium tumefaciens]|nr:hypothetical protein AWN88_11330 [Agrobacterium tumefaciens]KAJ36248.1 hypothetical protein BW45_23155 [Agrobacterium tumefaciens]
MIKHTFKAILQISAPPVLKTWKIRHKILPDAGKPQGSKKENLIGGMVRTAGLEPARPMVGRF